MKSLFLRDVTNCLYCFLATVHIGRPTKPVEWWGEDSNQKILGGRDELGGGTWLGCTKDGLLAFLTNFREPEPHSGTRSRGELPKRFLEVCPLDFLLSFGRNKL